MPIYEYRCEPCEQVFETLIRRPEDVAHCPKCGAIDVVKQFSVPAAAHTGQGSSLPLCAADDRPACGPGNCATGMCSFD